MGEIDKMSESDEEKGCRYPSWCVDEHTQKMYESAKRKNASDQILLQRERVSTYLATWLVNFEEEKGDRPGK